MDDASEATPVTETDGDNLPLPRYIQTTTVYSMLLRVETVYMIFADGVIDSTDTNDDFEFIDEDGDGMDDSAEELKQDDGDDLRLRY